ncbi:MAG: hypothetical protein V1728_04195 [Candidatus Micrarchaeota archaeon]
MSADKDALSGLKIAKNTYLFSQRKRYAPVEHYSIKRKTAASPIEQLVAKFGGRPPAKKGARSPRARTAASTPDSPLALAIKAGLAALFILLSLVAWLLVSSASGSSSEPPAPAVPPSPNFSASFDARVLDAHLLSYGTPFGPPTYQPYALLLYSGSNLSRILLSGQLYDSPPTRQVFVLRYANEGADTLPSFRSALADELSTRGLLVSDIGIDELAGMPGGSTLLVPTGLMPQALIDDPSGTTPSIFNLSSRGVTVIYVGLPYGAKLLLPSGAYAAPSEVALKAVPVTFDARQQVKSSDGFGLDNPLYSISTRTGGTGYSSSIEWGSISVLAVGNGSILFIPQTLDGGWKSDGAAAARDIARLIDEAPQAGVRSVLSGALPPGNGTVPSDYATLFFDTPTDSSSGVMRLKFKVTDSNNLTRQVIKDWPVAQYGALLYADNPVLLPKFLGGGKVGLTARLPGPGPCTKLYLELVQNSSVLERYELEQRCTPMNDTTRTSSISTGLGPGAYILRLASSDSRQIWAATRVIVQNLDIAPEGKSADQKMSFHTGQFNFSFSSGGQGMSVPSVLVSVPGARLPSRAFANQSRIVYDAGTELSAGNYTFLFDFGDGYTQNVLLSYTTQKAFWEQPTNLALMAIATVQFIILFFFFQRPAKQLYSLDIPDFPPQSVSKIPLSAAQALAVFEQVNRTYAWERMPLREEEIKNGLRKIVYNGKSVVIGDYNLQQLLLKLAERGLIEEDLGYWAPKRWSREGGIPMARMAMFRSLRDLFVLNAVRFSKLDASGASDLKILIGPDPYFLQFYAGSSDVVPRSLASARLGYTWIIFRDMVERDKFSASLLSSEPQLIALKMEVEAGRVCLLSLEDVGEMLKKLKIGGL